jgi:GWxTD domain-containing protein
MKKLYFLSIFVCLLLCNNPLQAKKLQVDLSYASFYSPEHGSYFETYLLVYGKSVNYIKNLNGKNQACIEITMLFKQNDSIKDFKKYNLNSQEFSDTNYLNFLDQQRFSLPNGNYVFELHIADKNSGNSPYKISQEISIDFPLDKISISGIELIESFKASTSASILTKSGYDLIPWLSDFYPENLKKLTFYAEIYNTEKIIGNGEGFLLSYYIESFETLRMIPNMIKMKREQTKPVNVVLGEFDINSLPSGNYNLAIEVKDKSNKILALNKLYFQRSNPNIRIEIKDIANIAVDETFAGQINNKDSLTDFIHSLYPISTDQEKMFINDMLSKVDMKLMQQYFLNFWLQRNNIDPQQDWLVYKKEVEKVNAKYSTRVRKGYDTDRGRVYLQYGPPNDIANKPFDVGAGVSDESWGTVPYEIWQYYKLKNQTNRKFVFANPDLIMNGFSLIHSDAIGEISNPNWRNLLSRQTDVYQEENTKWDQGKAGELYKNPH